MRRMGLAVLVSTLLSTFAVACGGGGSISFGGGIGGTGIVIGVITGFGSVEVEGVRFDTTNATISIDGEPATEADLDIGMLVKVVGEIADDGATGVATAIELESVVAGPIAEIFQGANGARVLRDQVVVDADTVFSGIDFATARLGDRIAVTGLIGADGTVRATHVRRLGDAAPLRIAGVIKAVDAVSETIQIRTLTIDISAASIVTTPPQGLEAGQVARVTLRAAPVDGLAEAKEVAAREIDAIERVDEKVLVRGLVTHVISAQRFILNEAIPVQIVDRTEFVNGTADDVVVDALVGIVGRVTRDRTLIAGRIAFPLSGPPPGATP